MPLLIAWFQTAFTALTAGFAAVFTRRIVAAISATAFYTSLTIGLGVAAGTAIATALENAPGVVLVGASWIIPPRFPQFVGIWLSAQAAAIAYRYALKVASYNPFRGVGG